MVYEIGMIGLPLDISNLNVNEIYLESIEGLPDFISYEFSNGVIPGDELDVLAFMVYQLKMI